jgi:hypothetical protein
MAQTFTATVHPTLTLCGHETNLIAKVSFRHVPARAATPPSFASGGDPPEPEGADDVVVTKLTEDCLVPLPLECPDWLSEAIAEMVDAADLLEAVDYGPDPDSQRDAMQDREMRRDRGELDDGSDE